MRKKLIPKAIYYILSFLLTLFKIKRMEKWRTYCQGKWLPGVKDEGVNRGK